MIKNIIFDLGGVVIDTNPAKCVEAFKRIGFDDMADLLGKSEQKGFLLDFETGETTLEEFCAAVRSHIGQTNPMVERLPDDKEIVDAYLCTSGNIPRKRIEAIYRLRDNEGRSFHVSALSNANKLHWEASKALFIKNGCLPDELFEHVWVSCEMGVVKPDREIYWRVLEDCDYNPCETLFIDDSEKNCDVAEEFGFRTFCPNLETDWWEHMYEIIKTADGQD